MRRYFNKGKNPAKISVLVLFCLMCCTCSRGMRSSATIFSVNIHTQAPLADFISSYDGCLVLDTPEDGLLEAVSKIRIENDTLYVLDEPRRAIHFFDCRTGIWLERLQKRDGVPVNISIYGISMSGILESMCCLLPVGKSMCMHPRVNWYRS